MKIAIVAPVLETVPPLLYGGIERIISELAYGVAKRDVKVSVYAAGESTLHGKNIRLIKCSPYPTRLKIKENRGWEITELLRVIAEQDQYDLIHFHYESIVTEIPEVGLNLLELIHKPIVITFHNQTHIPKHIKFYRQNKRLWHYNYVSISRDQQQPLKFLNFAATVYNGIPVNIFPFNNKPKDHLMFLGRATEVKGLEEAIAIAKISNHKLYIAAKVDPSDEKYYREKIKPKIDGKQIIWLGEMDFLPKIGYLKHAKALLFPIKWHEPFGLVMTEAMACGTPVIATKIGSTKEIIDHGKTGFLVNKRSIVKESVAALKKIPTLDRQAVRETVEKRFSSETMINNYLATYRKILKNKLT